MDGGCEVSTYCHHCGGLIVWNRTYPDAGNSHWAHAILVHNGKAHSVDNALMEQRCKDGRNWATPKRTYHELDEDTGEDSNPDTNAPR